MARAYLAENDQLAAPGDHVELEPPLADVAADDLEATLAQVTTRQIFGAAAEGDPPITTAGQELNLSR